MCTLKLAAPTRVQQQTVLSPDVALQLTAALASSRAATLTQEGFSNVPPSQLVLLLPTAYSGFFLRLACIA